MTKSDLFLAFGNVKNDFLTAAIDSMKTNLPPAVHTRSRLRYALIAATLALLIAMFPIAVMLGNRTTPPPDPPVTDGYLSIKNIPGAIIHSGNDYPILSEDRDFPLSIEDYINYVKKQPSAIGTSTHITTVSVPYTQKLPTFTLLRTLTISVFDLTVTTPINQLKSGQTVRILTFCLYTPSGEIAMQHGFEDCAVSAIEHPTGYYVLNDFQNISSNTGITQFITVNGIKYDLSQFADYYFADYYQTDGKTFHYFRDIHFNEIQE